MIKLAKASGVRLLPQGILWSMEGRSEHAFPRVCNEPPELEPERLCLKVKFLQSYIPVTSKPPISSPQWLLLSKLSSNAAVSGSPGKWHTDLLEKSRHDSHGQCLNDSLPVKHECFWHHHGVCLSLCGEFILYNSRGCHLPCC